MFQVFSCPSLFHWPITILYSETTNNRVALRNRTQRTVLHKFSQYFVIAIQGTQFATKLIRREMCSLKDREEFFVRLYGSFP